jgi:hypothetical protein
MSEYQYYEFRAIDRPLTQAEMRELRAISTRAQITSTSFINVYNYGDFRGNPGALMDEYFDAFLYYANWGTRQVMLRLPRALLDVEQASAYCTGDHASVRASGDFVVMEYLWDSESGYYEEGDEDEEDEAEDEEYGDEDYDEDDYEDAEGGEGRLSSIVPLRAVLLGGDLRPLYLGWLLGAQMGDLEGKAPEPPVPPGLGRLSGPLQAFADYLRIDRDLIAVAAERSTGGAPSGPSREEWAAWIGRLPEGEKDALLLRMAEGREPHLHGELLQRFRRDQAAAEGETEQPAVPPRTVAELIAAGEGHAKERRRRQTERQAAARAAYLDTLAAREPELWREVEALIDARKAKEYDEAITLLTDLRDLNTRAGRQAEFEDRIRALRERHRTKASFITRLDGAGIGTRQKARA